MEGNHLSPRNLTCCVRISNPFQLCSSYKMFRFNSSPRGCRSELTPLNRGNEGNRLFKRKLLQQTVPVPQKGGNLPCSDRPQLTQQLCRELPFFSNGEYFLSEDTSKQGRLYAMHRSKGCCISFCQRTQVLTKIPVFPMEKHMLCLPRVFTKLIKPIAASLRKRGIRIIVYLDDFLILGSSIKESKANTQLTLDLLQ